VLHPYISSSRSSFLAAVKLSPEAESAGVRENSRPAHYSWKLFSGTLGSCWFRAETKHKGKQSDRLFAEEKMPEAGIGPFSKGPGWFAVTSIRSNASRLESLTLSTATLLNRYLRLKSRRFPRSPAFHARRDCVSIAKARPKKEESSWLF
jgi:hypothetical protein